MESKTCKHSVQLEFNHDEIVSYCAKCGKILDRYVKINIIDWGIAPCTSNIGINGTHTITDEHNTTSEIRG